MSEPIVIGIDPGLSGYLVRIQGPLIEWEPMPVSPKPGSEIQYWLLRRLLRKWLGEEDTGGKPQVFLERVHPWAMSAKSAFGFGRGFALVEAALMELQLPYTLVEPSKWMAAMHQGIKKDLKPKAKSLLALKRLYPHICSVVPKTKARQPHDGAVDAFLIAQWGKRQLDSGFY